jgi:hypothetical protein
MTGIDALTMLRSGKAVLITLTDDYRIQIEATNGILPNGEVETSIRVYGTQLNNDILLYYILNEKWTVMK